LIIGVVNVMKAAIKLNFPGRCHAVAFGKLQVALGDKPTIGFHHGWKPITSVLGNLPDRGRIGKIADRASQSKMVLENCPIG
jgi:hypothetical protein